MSLTVSEEINKRAEELDSMEQLLGKGLYMPSNPVNSAQRKIMESTQLEHNIGLLKPEIPLLGTGYEPEFGKSSSSYKQAKEDYLVIAKVNKFSFITNQHYWLIVQNQKTFEYDVIERKPCEYITESYGFLYNNKKVDSYREGNIIQKGDVYGKSNSFDDFNNRMDGRNLMTTYIANEHTKEDAIEISETAQKVMSAPLVKKLQVIMNENDIPLNIYGDNNIYKIFPNITEDTLNGLIMTIRREKNDDSLFSQSINRLQDIMISDEKKCIHGKVVDIDIYCNNQELLYNNQYFKQVESYNNEKKAFDQTIVSIVKPLIKNCKCSYELQKLYKNCKSSLEGKQYIIDKPFSGVMIEFTLIEKNEVQVGDKLSNRFGGKGVVSRIISDELMPRVVVGGEEKRIDLLFNISTCINRLNPGQLFEMSINNVGQYIVQYLKSNILEIREAMKILKIFFNAVAPDQGKALFSYFDNVGDEIKKMFIDSIIEEDGIQLSQKPMSEATNLDTVTKLYNTLPFDIHQSVFKVPQADSMGNIRFIEARRRIVAAKEYIWRLKQYGEEKFSAVSLASTNIRNENTRSNSKKNHKSIHSKTPVKFFGEMETNDLMHLGVENVIINLMLYANSPRARKLCESLLIDNPYNINIKLDSRCKNRSVEILNAYLTTMGIQFNFVKKPRKLKVVCLKKVVNKVNPHGTGQVVVTRVNPELAIPEKHFERVLESYKDKGLLKKVAKRVICKKV